MSTHFPRFTASRRRISSRSGYPYIGIPGVGNYKSLLPVLADLKSRGLQTVYECMDMDKMMDLTCRCDCMEKCIVCGTPERLLRKQECPQKRRKRDTIRKGCLKLYDMCEKLGLNCQRISWDTDADGLWLGNYKGVDDWIYSKPPEEKESFYWFSQIKGDLKSVFRSLFIWLNRPVERRKRWKSGTDHAW